MKKSSVLLPASLLFVAVASHADATTTTMSTLALASVGEKENGTSSAVGADPSSSRRRQLGPGTVLLDFEGLTNGEAVGNYYNGGGGGQDLNFGVQFGSLAVASVDADALPAGSTGGGEFANEPSPDTALFFTGDGPAGAYLSVDKGFTMLAFRHAGVSTFTITIYEGPNATGPILFTETVPGSSTCVGCGDPSGAFGYWYEFSWEITGGGNQVGRSASFTYGNIQRLPYIDNMELELVEPPTQSPTQTPSGVPTKAPTKVPTSDPTSAPTSAPTAAPTSAPTKAPTSAPTSSATLPPTRFPTQAPVAAAKPTCNRTTYWVYNATSNHRIRQLVPNSSTCLVHPYSIEIRPCVGGALTPPPGLAILVKLVRVHPDGRRTVVVSRRRAASSAPYLLFGRSGGDPVLPSPKSLANGMYRLLYSVGPGSNEFVVVFTQSCPCGPKGKKGCRM